MKRIAMFAGGLLAAHVASAGVYVETVTHNITTDSTKPKQTMYVQGSSGKFVNPDGTSVLIKGDTMHIINDGERSYLVFDKATMQEFAKRISAVMEQQKEQLAKLPPEQRAQAEQSLGGMAAAEGKQRTVEVKDTGKSDKVDGRACKLWDVIRDGQLDEQICVVPFSALPGKEDFKAVFASFAKVFDEMAKSIPMLSGMMANEFDALAKVNGYPVRQRNYDDRGKLEDEETLVKVWREETIPASTLEIPAGYKLQKMPGSGM